MKKCRICHQEISPSAKPCPNCGEKEPFRSQKDYAIFGGIVILLAMGLMFYLRA